MDGWGRVGVGLWGQCRCEQRIEVFVKITKKKKIAGRVGRREGEGVGLGVRVDMNREVKFL